MTAVILPGFELAFRLPLPSLPTALSELLEPSEKVVYYPVPASTSSSAPG